MAARSSRETWAKRVQRWTDSGLSAGEFGAEIGVNPRTLTYWKWRLKKESASRPRPRSRGRVTPPVALSFVELTPPGTSAESIEVVLQSGHRVRVPVGFDDATLARLVAVLEQRG